MGWDGPNLVFRDGTLSLLYLLRGWSGHSFLFDMRDKGEWDGWRIRHRCALFVINETHVLISRPHYFSLYTKKTPSMARWHRRLAPTRATCELTGALHRPIQELNDKEDEDASTASSGMETSRTPVSRRRSPSA